MFCQNCGNKLDEGAKFCSQCGAALQAAEIESRPAAQAEELVMQGAGQVIKSAVLANTGSFVLTNRRLIFNKGGNIVAGKVITEGKFLFDIPLISIKRVEPAKKGLVKTILIEHGSGEQLHLSFLKNTQWLIAIQGAVEKAR